MTLGAATASQNRPAASQSMAVEQNRPAIASISAPPLLQTGGNSSLSERTPIEPLRASAEASQPVLPQSDPTPSPVLQSPRILSSFETPAAPNPAAPGPSRTRLTEEDKMMLVELCLELAEDFQAPGGTDEWWRRLTAEFQKRAGKAYRNCKGRMREEAARRKAYREAIGDGEQGQESAFDRLLDEWIDGVDDLEREAQSVRARRETDTQEALRTREFQAHSVQNFAARQRIQQDDTDASGESSSRGVTQRGRGRSRGNRRRGEDSRSRSVISQNEGDTFQQSINQIAGSIERFVTTSISSSDLPEELIQLPALVQEQAAQMREQAAEIAAIRASANLTNQLLQQLIRNQEKEK
jgi:hypothetical protein